MRGESPTRNSKPGTRNWHSAFPIPPSAFNCRAGFSLRAPAWSSREYKSASWPRPCAPANPAPCGCPYPARANAWRSCAAAPPHTTHQLPPCRIEYRYHPCHGAEVERVRALRSFEDQIDIVRFDDGQQIAVPRWMLDPVYCAQLPQEQRPRIAVKALLRLADWVARQGLLGRQAARHAEGSTKMKGKHALRENSSTLSVPAAAGESDAVGQTPRAHARARTSAPDADAATSHRPSRTGKEQR